MHHIDRLYSLATTDTSVADGPIQVEVYANTRHVTTIAREHVLRAFEADLHSYLAEFARTHVFVHAGVVGWKGRALLFPGRSGTGKSSLVAALLQAGATYYSDEYAVLDASGRVHPFPRPLSLRSTPHGPQRVPCTVYGARAGRKPLIVGAVVVTRYAPGACWRPRSLSSAQAVMALFANTVCARRRPLQALQTLRLAVAQACAVTGPRGDAQDAVPNLIRTVYSGR